MCRKNLAVSAAMIALGTGILLGGWISSCILRFLMAGCAIGFGVFLLGGKYRHK